jgi:hypothetical protein
MAAHRAHRPLRDLERLDAMAFRYFDAKTLDEVLGKPKRRNATSTVRPSETRARDATPNTRDARP